MGDRGSGDGDGDDAARDRAVVTSQSGGVGSSTLAGDLDVILAGLANLDLLQYSTSDSRWHNKALLTSVSAALSADVTMTITNTWFSGPSVSVTTGTWLVWAFLGIIPSGGTQQGVRLFDGTNTLASAQSTSQTGSMITIPVLCLYVAAGTTTITVQGIENGTGGVIKAAMSTNPVGNNACQIMAVKVG